MRIMRFIKFSLFYFKHDADFMKRFPQSTKRRFLTMIKTAWQQSKEQKKRFPTQEELISYRVDSTIRGDFLIEN